MAEIVLFHHVQGRTKGVEAFADTFRQAGHTVHVPDVFDGRTFDTLDEGIAYAKEVGFGTLQERSSRPSWCTRVSHWARCRPSNSPRPEPARGGRAAAARLRPGVGVR